jgi:hypothetical protein
MPDIDHEAQAQESEIRATVAALGKPDVFADPRIQAAIARLLQLATEQDRQDVPDVSRSHEVGKDEYLA